MAKKVLGFGELCSICEKEICKARASVCLPCVIKAKEKVVSLEWLIKYCKEHGVFTINKEQLIKAAKKESEKNK